MVKKKWKQIVQGMFFLFCMVGVFMPDTTVHAEGILKATDQVKWEEGKDLPVGVEDGAEYNAELWMEIPEILIHVKYDDVEVDDPEQLTLTEVGKTQKLEWLEKVEDTGIIKINAEDVGDYELSYDEGEASDKITLHIEYPKVGFYAGAEQKVNTLLDGFSANKDDTSFYMILQSATTLKEQPFIIKYGEKVIADKTEVEKYITYEQATDNSNVYTITPKPFVARAGFTLKVVADISGEAEPYEQEIWIGSNYGTGTLYWTDSIGKNEENDLYQYNSDNVVWSNWEVFEEILSFKKPVAMVYKEGDEEPDESNRTCCLKDSLTVTDIFGNRSDALSLETMENEEGEFLYISPKEAGDYLVIYNLNQDDEAVIRVHVSEPSVGLYASENDEVKNVLNEFDLAEGDSFYIVFRNDWALNTEGKRSTEDGDETNDTIYPFGVEVSENDIYKPEELKNYITYEKIENAKYETYKITPNLVIQDMALIVNAYREYEDEHGEQQCETMGCMFGIKNTASHGLEYTEDFSQNATGAITGTETSAEWKGWTESIWFGLNAVRSTVAIRYGKNNYITAEQIQIVDEFGKETSDITCRANDEWESAIDFFPTQQGNYKLLYTVDGKTKILPITVDFPEVGFYTSKIKSAETIIKDEEFSYGRMKDRIIYIIRDGGHEYTNESVVIGTWNEDANEWNTVTEMPEWKDNNIYCFTITDENEATISVSYIYDIHYSYDDDEYYNRNCSTNVYLRPKRLSVGNVNWINADEPFEYDGKEHEIKIDENDLPEGVKPIYSNNKETNAGTYTANVEFGYVDEDYDDYYPVELFGAEDTYKYEWEILQASIDINVLKWDYDDTNPFTYNGKEQSVGIKDLPPGISATYMGNTETDAGTYTAKVTLKDENNNYLDFDEGELKELLWEIRKATFDTSKVAWNYKDAFVYDGTEKTVALAGLPTGLTVEYTGNKATDAGTYTAKATFKYDDKNYEAPVVSVSELKWTITKKEESKPGTTEATQPATTEAPKAQETTQEAKQEVKAGQTVTSGNASYKVVSTATGEKTVEYVGNTDKKASKIVIPETVQIGNETYKVIAIADNAFKNNTKLKEVTIPANIQVIGKNAFAGCKNLKTIKFLGKDIKKIGKKAWKGVSKKATIQVPKKVKKKYKKLLKKAGYKGTIKGK